MKTKVFLIIPILFFVKLNCFAQVNDIQNYRKSKCKPYASSVINDSTNRNTPSSIIIWDNIIENKKGYNNFSIETPTPFSYFGVGFQSDNNKISPSLFIIKYRTKKTKGEWSEWREASGETAPNETPTNLYWSTIIFVNDSDLHNNIEMVLIPPTNVKIKYVRIDVVNMKNKNINEKEEGTIQIKNNENETLTQEKGCPQPTIIPRSDWCGSFTTCQSPIYTPTILSSPTHVIMHHGDGTDYIDGYAIVRAYWDYHVNSRGWDDIGYNYLVDKYGNIFQGRFNPSNKTQDVHGAHAGSSNGKSIGICFLGNTDVTNSTTVQISKLEDLLAWWFNWRNLDPTTSASILNQAGTNTLNLPRICGHRDVTSTTCPGNNLYNLLSTIRIETKNKIATCNGSTSFADLIITAGTQNVNPITVSAGSNITVKCSEDNIGTASSGANEVTLWLSADANLNTSNDVYLGQITGFPNLSPNTCSNILSTSIQIPPNTTQGNYYLFFWADGNNDVNELIENNNFASKQITVTTQAQASLTVSYPNGGETLYKGSNYNITWSSSNVTGNIQIELYKNGSNVLQLAASAPNTGTYPFNPPSNLTNGSDYKIGISAMSGSVSDFSNSFFTITSQSCTNWSLNPTSANFIASGGSGSFIVSATGTGCTYSATSNNSWINSIVYPGSGTTNYNVDANTGTARTGSISIKDGSSGATVLTFNITQAGQSSLTVTYPNGGETLYKGSNYNITWNSSNVTGNIQIDLYKNGSNVLQLAASASNTGSYSFNPPSNLTNGNDYKIGISAMSGSISDFSNSPFTIATQAQPSLTVSYPNGGETLYKGSNYNITWSSSNVTGNIQIDLYKNGSNVLQLAASAPNTGTYSFNPPSNLTNGSDYKIGISAMSGGVSDFSNSSFTIISNGNPVINVSGNLSFGSIPVGSSSQQILKINNTGSATLIVSSINYPSGFSGSWSGNIGALDSQNVTVTFSPTATTSYGGNITVNSNSTGGTSTIACSGTGSVAPTPAISLSGNLNFGGVKVGSSSQQPLTIHNIGNASLTVLSINYPSGFSGNWIGNIGVGNSQNIIVTFSPISTIYYSGNLTINSNATSGTTTIQCSGLGVSSTGINDIDNVKQIIVYPNPTTGLLTLKSNDLADGNYKIFLSNALGQKLLEKEFKITTKSREIQIDIKELPSGMYFLTIQSTKIYQTFSVQKQ